MSKRERRDGSCGGTEGSGQLDESHHSTAVRRRPSRDSQFISALIRRTIAPHTAARTRRFGTVAHGPRAIAQATEAPAKANASTHDARFSLSGWPRHNAQYARTPSNRKNTTSANATAQESFTRCERSQQLQRNPAAGHHGAGERQPADRGLGVEVLRVTEEMRSRAVRRASPIPPGATPRGPGWRIHSITFGVSKMFRR